MNNKQRVSVGVISTIAIVSLLMISTLTNGTVSATGKGLKVNVFVNNANCIIGSDAKVRVDAGQQAQVKFVSIQNTDSVIQFQFGSGEVQVGDSIFVSVTVGDQTETASGSNGEQRAPEDINVNWDCFDDSSSSSASSSSSSSASASANSSLCLFFCRAQN